MSKTEQKPMWLQDKDGNIRLYAGADVESAKANGMKEPDGVRGNGEPWNVDAVEGETSQVDALAEVSKADAERRAKIAKREDAEAAKSAKSAPEPAAPSPDLRVEIVDTKAKKAAK